MMDRLPIFFGYTRSFLLGVLPALLTLFDVMMLVIVEPGTVGPISNTISMLVALTGVMIAPASITQVLLAISPIYALIVAQQRSHAARPYSIHPSDK
jgi:hypothetical protein